MAAITNSYLSINHLESEGDLVDSLIIESIQIKGLAVKYCLREMVNRDYLFGESPISSFKDFIEIEMYIDSVRDYNGYGDLLSKFD